MKIGGDEPETLSQALRYIYNSSASLPQVIEYEVFEVRGDNEPKYIGEKKGLEYFSELLDQVYEENELDQYNRVITNVDLEGLKLDFDPEGLDGQEEYAGVPYNPEAMAGKSGGQGKA